MMIEKEFQMKKVLASLLIAATIATPAMADGRGHGHGHGGYNPWVPFIAGAGLTYLATRPQTQYYPVYEQRPVVVYQQPQVVYSLPTQAPVIVAPGQVCELKSEMINGQIVTGNFCYYR